MKKLESLNQEKFRVSNDELTQIRGGYGGSTYDFTAMTTNSMKADGTPTTDYKATDIALD